MNNSIVRSRASCGMQNAGVQALADFPARMTLETRLKPGLQPLGKSAGGATVRLTMFLVTWMVTMTPGLTGEYNTTVDIGAPSPTWSQLPTTDDSVISMAEFDDAKIVVVAFICNSCPYAVDAEDRLIELHKTFHDKSVVVVAVNVNLIDEDALPAMTAKANEKKFPFHYVFDESQQIAKDFGAKYTPEFFVLAYAADSKQRTIAYMGSFDDSPDGTAVTKRYVHDAIEALLAENPIEVTETVPIGCRIRMKRERRSPSK